MIKEIYLENFKGFKEQRIALSDLTVFSGINGMGKSTCIQSMLLLRQSYLLGKLNSSGGLVLDGEYSKPGNGKDVFFWGAADSEKLKVEILTSNDNTMKFSFSYEKDSDLQPLSESSDLTGISGHSLFNNNFFYLSADRLSPERDVFPASQSSITNGNLGKHGQYTVHYIARNQRKTLDIPELKHLRSKTDSLLENIENWMGEITPGIRLQPQFYPEINSARLSYNFEINNAVTDEFKPINVGYGLTYVLPIIAQILISKPGQIVVIENPESHLHPSAQSSIAKLCTIAARHGVQIIMETHSDHIINGILIAINQNKRDSVHGISSDKVKMLFVEREKDSHKSTVTDIAIREDGRITNAPTNFFDQFAKDIKTILGFNGNISERKG